MSVPHKKVTRPWPVDDALPPTSDWFDPIEAIRVSVPSSLCNQLIVHPKEEEKEKEKQPFSTSLSAIHRKRFRRLNVRLVSLAALPMCSVYSLSSACVPNLFPSCSIGKTKDNSILMEESFVQRNEPYFPTLTEYDRVPKRSDTTTIEQHVQHVLTTVHPGYNVPLVSRQTTFYTNAQLYDKAADGCPFLLRVVGRWLCRGAGTTRFVPWKPNSRCIRLVDPCDEESWKDELTLSFLDGTWKAKSRWFGLLAAEGAMKKRRYLTLPIDPHQALDVVLDFLSPLWTDPRLKEKRTTIERAMADHILYIQHSFVDTLRYTLLEPHVSFFLDECHQWVNEKQLLTRQQLQMVTVWLLQVLVALVHMQSRSIQMNSLTLDHVYLVRDDAPTDGGMDAPDYYQYILADPDPTAPPLTFYLPQVVHRRVPLHAVIGPQGTEQMSCNVLGVGRPDDSENMWRDVHSLGHEQIRLESFCALVHRSYTNTYSTQGNERDDNDTDRIPLHIVGPKPTVLDVFQTCRNHEKRSAHYIVHDLLQGSSFLDVPLLSRIHTHSKIPYKAGYSG